MLLLLLSMQSQELLNKSQRDAFFLIFRLVFFSYFLICCSQYRSRTCICGTPFPTSESNRTNQSSTGGTSAAVPLIQEQRLPIPPPDYFISFYLNILFFNYHSTTLNITRFNYLIGRHSLLLSVY